MSFPEVMVVAATVLLALLTAWLVAVLIVAYLRPTAVHLLVPATIATVLGMSATAQAEDSSESSHLAGLTMPDRPTVTWQELVETTPPRVIVREGDTLWALAAAQLPVGTTPADIAVAVSAWHDHNRTVIGDDPDLIRPGQVLIAPQEIS